MSKLLKGATAGAKPGDTWPYDEKQYNHKVDQKMSRLKPLKEQYILDTKISKLWFFNFYNDAKQF